MEPVPSGAQVSRQTLQDVATHAGVSKATASRVLNGSRQVDPDTRRRVLEAMAELEYTPTSAARRLSFGRTLTISVVTSYLTRPQAAERLRGVDLVFIRELTGGIYFGQPKGKEVRNGLRTGFDTMVYDEAEIRRIVELAFEVARKRSGRVTSIDKANVLATMQVWREVATEVGKENPDIKLDHQLVDSAAMRLVTDPASFDVIVSGNMFGDILSDEGAVLTGSLGLLPSASLGEGTLGVYEPIHGSAPDIAGRGIANPLGTILSAAMLLRHSLNLDEDAKRIENAVQKVLDSGLRTADLSGGQRSLGTSEMADAVVAAIDGAPAKEHHASQTR